MISDVILRRMKSELNLIHSDKHRPFRFDEIGTDKLEKQLKEFLSVNEFGIIGRKGEVFPQPKLEWLQNIVRTENPNFKINCSTLTEIEFGTHPLTNYSLWSDRNFPDDFILDNLFDYKIKSNKSNPWILSMRRKSISRTKLWERIEFVKSGIARYNHKIIPSTELLNDYDISYISIIAETTYNQSNREVGECIQISEKFPIGVHTKTLPIVLGAKRLNSYLTKYGFFTLNDYFNLNDTSDLAEKKLSEIIRIIDNYSIEQVMELYKLFENNIEQNYKLQNQLFEINNNIKNDNIK